MEEKKVKQCSYCKEEYPISNFYNNKATKDGFDSYCKECRNNKKRKPFDKHNMINGRALRMEDFYPPEKQWKRLETCNKYDATRLDELLYNGGDISEAFYMRVHDKLEYEKSKKKKRRWGK